MKYWYQGCTLATLFHPIPPLAPLTSHRGRYSLMEGMFTAPPRPRHGPCLRGSNPSEPSAGGEARRARWVRWRRTTSARLLAWQETCHCRHQAATPPPAPPRPAPPGNARTFHNYTRWMETSHHFFLRASLRGPAPPQAARPRKLRPRRPTASPRASWG